MQKKIQTKYAVVSVCAGYSHGFGMPQMEYFDDENKAVKRLKELINQALDNQLAYEAEEDILPCHELEHSKDWHAAKLWCPTEDRELEDDYFAVWVVPVKKRIREVTIMSSVTERVAAMIAADEAKARDLAGLSDKVRHGATAFTDEECKSIAQALAFQSAHVQQEAEKRKHALECGSEDGNLDSHDEQHILSGCISLLEDAVATMYEYLDYCGIPQDDDDERFQYTLYYTEVVRRLFLWNTSHSGGTSTWAKCRELGVDPGERVEFAQEQNEED